MKVLIVEDEKPAIEKLTGLLKETNKQVEVAGVVESVEKAINWLHSHPDPDLMFMDIQLEDGICFEIFDSVKVNVPVIFTTAYDAYALKAFKVNSIDYLLKPVEIDPLKRAIEKFEKIYTPVKTNLESLNNLITNLMKQTYKERFFIKIGQKFKSVSSNEIACFLVTEKNTYLQTYKDQRFDMDYSLDQIERMMNPAQFMRVNRSHIISIEAISEIISYSGSRLKIKLKSNAPGDDIIVSRERIHEFRKWMDR